VMSLAEPLFNFASSFIRKLYKGESGDLLFPSSLLLLPLPLLQTLRASELLHSPCAQLVDVLQDPRAKEQDGQEQYHQCINQLGAH
jgi:hypothetical protein